MDLREIARERLGIHKRSGDLVRGPCPLCKTSKYSSAFVVWETNYYCLACGERGGVRRFFTDVLHEEPPRRLAPRSPRPPSVEPDILAANAWLAIVRTELTRRIATGPADVFDLYDLLQRIEDALDARARMGWHERQALWRSRMEAPGTEAPGAIG